MWQPYADAEGFVLVCPSLADESGGWYVQDGEAILHEVLREVRLNVNAEKKLFIAGYSAGAEFALAYALDNPNSIRGAALLSCGNYYAPWKDSQDFPYLVVIGDQDFPDSQTGASDFTQYLTENGYSIQSVILPGVKHEITEEALDLTIDFYRQINAK
jgi:predicted esterase